MSGLAGDQFTGTAPWYARFRPGLEPEVRRKLIAQVTQIPRPRRLLDLGTGTGQIIAALASDFDEFVGVDVEQELLDMTDITLDEDVMYRTTLIHARAEDFAPPAGWKPHLITICRAFHWMDQPRVLAHCAEVIADDGRLAVLGDGSFWTTTEPWKDIIRSTIQEFLGEERRAGSGTFSDHGRPYSEILAESAFTDVATIEIPVTRAWDIDSILGYLYSTSFSSQDLYGERQPAFDSQLRTRLADFQTAGGRFEETVDFTLYVGHLP